ncbi:alpha-xenorhabdolysin family binary toxin subunit A [Pseudomonas alkylphenolica]|uniref:Binary cytotoxin component XaxA n=1 Tax=Pseudomonas alkylphenolica TaxID=237609 RepID=A0A077FAB0_9PSED|nr:alpha-xenorhabdolysin family binary toxin subunit A [Pseudomonas alkylphenolica]AIL60326.1 binary cytotoxin component XaxA [Pseudomonas alkylphenolica]
MEVIQEEPVDHAVVPVEELDLKTRAKSLPEKYFSFLDSRAEQDRQGTALLTKQNLQKIKGYVRVVDDLPQSEEEIRLKIDTAVLDVDVNRVLVLCEVLYLHASKWRRLEDQIARLGPTLELFAGKLASRGGALLEDVNNSDTYQEIIRKKGAGGANALLDKGFEPLRELLQSKLANLIEEIKETSKEIEEVNALARSFETDIPTQVRPRLRQVIAHIESSLKDVNTSELRTKIDALDEDVKNLKDDYDYQVGLSFTGLSLGPIGLVITGGVFGSKAEEIRAKKNELLEQRAGVARQLQALEPALESFLPLQLIIEDLDFRMTDLTSAAGKLKKLWVTLNQFSQASLREIEHLTTSSELEEFVQDFTEVIAPWNKIGGICSKLSILFSDLVEEASND